MSLSLILTLMPVMLGVMPVLQGAGLALAVFGAFVLGVWAVFFLVDPGR